MDDPHGGVKYMCVLIHVLPTCRRSMDATWPSLSTIRPQISPIAPIGQPSPRLDPLHFILPCRFQTSDSLLSFVCLIKWKQHFLNIFLLSLFSAKRRTCQCQKARENAPQLKLGMRARIFAIVFIFYFSYSFVEITNNNNNNNNN